jgi:hypothetical protein
VKHPRKRNEGAALFVVLMIIMVGTASAVFSATTVSHEVRGAGFARKQMQTRYAARAGIIAALEWFDIFGPETVRDIMVTKSATDTVQFTCTTDWGCYPEPPLAGNRSAYRLYPQHYEALQSTDGGNTPGLLQDRPIDDDPNTTTNYSFGPTSAYRPVVVTDIYDEHIINKLSPGAAAQGGTKFKYMRTTLTARGRAQLRDVADQVNANDFDRERNESAADMRAYIVSGPFVTGTQ